MLPIGTTLQHHNMQIRPWILFFQIPPLPNFAHCSTQRWLTKWWRGSACIIQSI